MKPQHQTEPSADGKSDPTFLSLQSTHARAEHWLTDVEFYMVEITFLQKLISQNFVNIFTADSARRKPLIEELESLEHSSHEIKALINQLLVELKEAIVGPVVYGIEPFREKIANLEMIQSDFIKTFRKVKREVFHLTELAIKSGHINPLTEKLH